MTDKPNLRIVKTMDDRIVYLPLHRQAPRQPSHDELLRAASDFPDLYAAFKPEPRTWRQELADDWREFASEVRGSPFSHAVVGIGTVVLWTVLLILPLVIGAGK